MRYDRRMLGRFALVAPLALVLLLGACGGGRSQVSFVSNERPSSQGAPQGLTPSGAHSENPNGSVELPNDDEVIEPEHPSADTKQERALVHIHGPNGVVCSGVVLGSRVVATAQQCLKAEGKGATVLGPDKEYRVEVAS